MPRLSLMLCHFTGKHVFFNLWVKCWEEKLLWELQPTSTAFTVLNVTPASVTATNKTV